MRIQIFCFVTENRSCTHYAMASTQYHRHHFSSREFRTEDILRHVTVFNFNYVIQLFSLWKRAGRYYRWWWWCWCCCHAHNEPTIIQQYIESIMLLKHTHTERHREQHTYHPSFMENKWCMFGQYVVGVWEERVWEWRQEMFLGLSACMREL